MRACSQRNRANTREVHHVMNSDGKVVVRFKRSSLTVGRFYSEFNRDGIYISAPARFVKKLMRLSMLFA
jgi:hypothetical protein